MEFFSEILGFNRKERLVRSLFFGVVAILCSGVILFFDGDNLRDESLINSDEKQTWIIIFHEFFRIATIVVLVLSIKCLKIYGKSIVDTELILDIEKSAPVSDFSAFSLWFYAMCVSSELEIISYIMMILVFNGRFDIVILVFLINQLFNGCAFYFRIKNKNFSFIN